MERNIKLPTRMIASVLAFCTTLSIVSAGGTAAFADESEQEPASVAESAELSGNAEVLAEITAVVPAVSAESDVAAEPVVAVEADVTAEAVADAEAGAAAEPVVAVEADVTAETGSHAETVSDAGTEASETPAETSGIADVAAAEFAEELKEVPAEAEASVPEADEAAGADGEVPADGESPESADETEAAEFTVEAEIGGDTLALTTYTAPAMLAASGTTASLLQDKITQALKAAKDAENTLSGRVQVILLKNTTYDGEVSISTEYEDYKNYTFADDFVLELTAEDADDDPMQTSEASTKFSGNMTIKGVTVDIRGVNAPGKISVTGEGSALNYYGSEKDDTVNVDVSDKATAVIDAGDGDDTVTINITTDAAVQILTGSGMDTVTASVDSGSVTIDTGADNDTVNVTSGNGGIASVDTGGGDDTVTIDARGGTGDLVLSTGDKNHHD